MAKGVVSSGNFLGSEMVLADAARKRAHRPRNLRIRTSNPNDQECGQLGNFLVSEMVLADTFRKRAHRPRNLRIRTSNPNGQSPAIWV